MLYDAVGYNLDITPRGDDYIAGASNNMGSRFPWMMIPGNHVSCTRPFLLVPCAICNGGLHVSGACFCLRQTWALGCMCTGVLFYARGRVN